MEIDLNSDLGEGCGHDADILPLITSANISCGFHAGDVHSALEALTAAAQLGVHVGAHPGYPDREHFGRRELAMDAADVCRLCARQISVLQNLARLAGVKLRYLKPHGALYHQAMRDDTFAKPVVVAAQIHGLAVIGLPGSRLASFCQGRVPFFAEGFADRRYRPDGTLVARSEPNAFVADPVEAVRQAQWLIQEKGVRTLCVHGDNPEAVAFVQALREALLQRGVTLKAFT